MYSTFVAWGTLNSCGAAKPSRKVGGWGREVGGLCQPPTCPPSKLEWKRAKSYSHLYGAQSTANDMRHLALCHDEFRGP
ncbi:hypothetical protein TNCV_1908041 [Trichonephila clavipes]|nr:hypothetical protein TNCV_1908041 [Trichonephila clavipes]